MESGFSRELLIHWGTNPKNSIVFTNRCPSGTLGHDLLVNGNNRMISVESKKRVKLTGAELDDFNRRKNKEKYK